MQPRALKDLAQVPRQQRLDVIAEGLSFLAEHVAALTSELLIAADVGCTRSLPMLQAQSEEETAKVFILLDLVRAGCDNKAVITQAGHFYSHLARCIYVEAFQMRPANFAEMRRLVGSMRASHYLDGPMDIDWIFRNELLDKRERDMYVDYVRFEEGGRWVSPADTPHSGFRPHTPAQDLVKIIARLGMTGRAGLEIVAKRWAGQQIDDETHWQVVAGINRDIVVSLFEAGLSEFDATKQDARRLIDRWTFPLSDLDLKEVRVSMDDLQAQRERRLDSYY